jgi:hypothetical protein
LVAFSITSASAAALAAALASAASVVTSGSSFAVVAVGVTTYIAKRVKVVE